MRFDVTLDAETAEPGGPVGGVARAPEAERSRRVWARLHFTETVTSHGGARGAGEYRVTELGPVTIHEGDLAEGEELRFDLELPEDALQTYSGVASRLSWYVEVVSDEPGFDSRGDAEVVVIPEARGATGAGDLDATVRLAGAA